MSAEAVISGLLGLLLVGSFVAAAVYGIVMFVRQNRR